MCGERIPDRHGGSSVSEEFVPVLRAYAVNRRGEVKNLETGCTIKPIKMATGYLAVCIKIDGKKTMQSIHRMVATAFLPKQDGKHVVNHLNGIKTDNRLENLEWCTHSENLKHARSTGLTSAPVQGYGEACTAAKLTWEKVAVIRDLAGKGRSYSSIAKVFGVHPSTISLIAQGKSWPLSEAPT